MVQRSPIFFDECGASYKAPFCICRGGMVTFTVGAFSYLPLEAPC